MVFGREKILEDIERILRDTNNDEKLKFSQLPTVINELVTKCNKYHKILLDVATEVGRATNSKVKMDDLVSQARFITDTLEAIKQVTCPQGLEIPHSDQFPGIVDVVKGNYNTYVTSKQYLTSIARVTDPFKTTPQKTTDSPQNIAQLVTNQPPSQCDDRASPRSISRQQVIKERGSHGGESTNTTDEVGRLRDELQDLRRDNESLKRDVHEYKKSLKRALTEVKKLDAVVATDQTEIGKLITTEKKLREDHALHIQRLAEEMDAKKAEIEDLKTTEQRLRDDHARSIHQLTAEMHDEAAEHAAHYERGSAVQKATHQADMDQMRIHHRLEVERFEGLIKDLGKSHDAKVEEQKIDVKAIHENWSRDLEQTVRDYESELRVLQRQHAQSQSEQEKLRVSMLEETNETWRTKLAKLQSEHEVQLAVKATQIEESCHEERLEWKRVLHEEMGLSRKRLSEQAQLHAVAMDKLERQYHQLQDMFLKQDDYSGLSDLEISRGSAANGEMPSIFGFTDMVGEVTTFARWEWRKDRKVWPEDTMISLVGTEQRRLKKLILGDAIWGLLYRLIFCSPFRILGEEGNNLEKNWKQIFLPDADEDESEISTEYEWPAPNVICEKYRWQTCEAAVESLTKASSPYDRLKTSFIDNQPKFRKRVLKTVEAYVELDGRKEQDLLKFLTNVVRMWLVFCSQRYRLRVIMPGSSEFDPEAKMKLAQEHNDLKFTVHPTLQRHGNAKGRQLQEVSIVAGCEGATATVEESRS